MKAMAMITPGRACGRNVTASRSVLPRKRFRRMTQATTRERSMVRVAAPNATAMVLAVASQTSLSEKISR